MTTSNMYRGRLGRSSDFVSVYAFSFVNNYQMSVDNIFLYFIIIE